MTDEQEIDDLILALATARWQKTAMIIAKASNRLEGEPGGNPEERVAERIRQLVETNRLESRGDLSRWRHSEVRRPASSRDRTIPC